MEQSFTTDALVPDLIFKDLKGEIIDYIISSYQVNIGLIYTYYWHTNIQVHCQIAYNGTEKDDFIHVHEVEKPGIYHAKFILITTTEMLKLIIMTTNITENEIKNCLNDYYVIKIPKRMITSSTKNTMRLYEFLDTFEIKLKSALINYDWRKLNGHILISLPDKMSHGMCFNKIIKKPEIKDKRKATIRCSTMMTGYDIKKLFHVNYCELEYLDDYEHKTIMGIYDLEHNEEKDGKKRYELKSVKIDKPFHYKRYTIEYTNSTETRRYLIITSANLTRQAWGTSKYVAKNAEMGIIWNSKKQFN